VSLENSLKSVLTEIFKAYTEIIAVYLFGSYLENKDQCRDIDLAVLLKHPARCQMDMYMELYPRLAEALSPLEPDLLFLHTATLPIRFEVISTGVVIYTSDDALRTDFEYITSGEYMDFRHYLDISRQELFTLIKEASRHV